VRRGRVSLVGLVIAMGRSCYYAFHDEILKEELQVELQVHCLEL